MESKELHAVMVPMPMLGHIYPLLHFAKALVARFNFTVTFVNNYFYHLHILAQESLSSSSSSNGKLRFEWVEDGLPPDFNFNNIWQTQAEYRQGCINMQAPLKALMKGLNQKHPPVTCVIFGSFFPSAHYAAMELGIPTVFFWSQSAAVFSIYRHMPLLDSNGFFPFKKALPECKEDSAQLVSYIPGVPPLYPEDLPTFLVVEDRNDSNLKMMELQFDLLKDCKTVVINSFYELEKEAFGALQEESLSVFAVGPLLSSKQAHGSSKHVTDFCRKDQEGLKSVVRDECLTWLDKQSMHSVLYISFGTLLNPTPEKIKGIALALRESKQPFIWVFQLRSFYNHSSGKFTEITSVAEMFPEHFLEDTADHGICVPWAPQQKVLAHPSVGAFLTHCGWNSTLESVSMGVPMIPLPIASDQTTNSKYVVDMWKVGMRLKLNEKGNVDSADLIRVLEVVFREEEGKELRKRAGKLKEVARRAIEIGSKNDTNHFFQALMDHIS